MRSHTFTPLHGESKPWNNVVEKVVEKGRGMKQAEVMRLPDGKYSAGDGLYLFVSGNGSRRSWVYRQMINGKRKEVGLGSASSITLAIAKTRASKLREALARGISIKDALGRTEDIEEVHMFRDVAAAAIENKCRVTQYKEGSKSEHRMRQILVDYALPVFGAREIGSITRDEIVECLQGLWFEHPETGKRLRGYLEMVFDYAVVNGWIQLNPAIWKGGIALFLPTRRKVQKTEHWKALTFNELKQAVGILRQKKGVGAAAILFGILTASRAVEFCKARWDEIDEDAAVWSCSPDHRKGDHEVPHRVPLPKQAMEILASLPRENEYLFPGQAGAHIALGSPRLMLRKACGKETTMHGCRSTFKDWATEAGYPDAMSEKQLSHQVGTEVERAYLRTDMLDQRRGMMQAWADELFG